VKEAAVMKGRHVLVATHAAAALLAAAMVEQGERIVVRPPPDENVPLPAHPKLTAPYAGHNPGKAKKRKQRRRIKGFRP
jgi:hypothetical protein